MTMSAQEAREVLNLQPGYERAELSIAYRRLVRSVHPDLLVDASEREARDASDLLAQANLANEVLRRSLRLNARDPEPVPTDPFAAARPFVSSWTASPYASTPEAAAQPRPRRTIDVRALPTWRIVAAAVVCVVALVGFIGFCTLIGP